MFWRQLRFGDMLDHYASIRSKAFGGITVSKSQQNLETAEDYLRIAMLFDWYGDYETAVRYVKKAVTFEPKAEDGAKKYFMQ